MDVQLREDLERLVNDHIRTGRYSRGEDVIREVQAWIREQVAGEAPEPPVRPPMTDEEFRQHLLQTGRISQLPDADWKSRTTDHWEPIHVEGEPVSQTILRERR
jgi:Arc/MetJ-type ribon-helix-helix transcriptional regulator